jgi:hypothetical protein
MSLAKCFKELQPLLPSVLQNAFKSFDYCYRRSCKMLARASTSNPSPILLAQWVILATLQKTFGKSRNWTSME